MSHILIDDIIIPPRLRVVDKAELGKITHSMKENGQLTPILVMQDGDGDDAKYILVSGAHRLEAVKLLGETHINASVRPKVSSEEARLWEIDENLMRHELNAFDRAKFLATRKIVWEKIHGKVDTTGGGDLRSATARKQLDMFAQFDADTRALLKLSTRTIQRDIATYHALTDEVKDMIASSWIAKSGITITKLVEVGNLFGTEKQVQAAQALIDDPDLRTPKNALGYSNSGGDDAYKRDANEIAVNKLKVLYIESNKEVKTAFIAYLINTPFFNETINEGIDGHE
ncbi:MAG: ParB/RepB/Spo0J family partition protein [Alphaproteobacteria bacterium]|nr:ParB/RepB/Spo0J family partition protein [Alphaproteobacteria bacterium]